MDPGALRHTPLREQHRALGARLVAFAGWEMPLHYEGEGQGIVEEHRAVRSAAGLFDVSHMGVISLTGPYAIAVADYLVTGSVAGLGDGQALYTLACNARGTILDDLILYRCGSERVLIVCNASRKEKMVDHIRAAAEHHCDLEDRSSATALLALQGPRAMEILARCGKDAARLGDLGSFRFRDAIVCNVPATVARTGYTGEDGVELFCRSTDAPALFGQLLGVGRDLGLRPCGLGCRDTLRLEARLALYGNEIDEQTHPFEAGLGWAVKLDKGDFVGREALVQIQRAPLTRRLVGFEVTGRGIARHGYPLLDREQRPVGVCTSGSPGPTVGKNIGLGYLPTALAEVGTEFFVDCRGKAVEARVVKTPFYKRRGTAT